MAQTRGVPSPRKILVGFKSRGEHGHLQHSVRLVEVLLTTPIMDGHPRVPCLARKEQVINDAVMIYRDCLLSMYLQVQASRLPSGRSHPLHASIKKSPLGLHNIRPISNQTQVSLFPLSSFSTLKTGVALRRPRSRHLHMRAAAAAALRCSR